MSVPQRFPYLPRVVVAVMSVVLLSVVGMTIATAQSSEPVSTGALAAPSVAGGLTPGEVVEVSGAGYAPGGSVDVTIESDPVLLKTVTADAAGAFVTTVTVPRELAAGAHTLKATGPDPAGGLRVLSIPVMVAGGPPGDSLPRTGTDVLPMVVVGVTAIAAGAAMLLARRHRA